jgi:hypothetical protein
MVNTIDAHIKVLKYACHIELFFVAKKNTNLHVKKNICKLDVENLNKNPSKDR